MDRLFFELSCGCICFAAPMVASLPSRTGVLMVSDCRSGEPDGDDDVFMVWRDVEHEKVAKGRLLPEEKARWIFTRLALLVHHGHKWESLSYMLKDAVR